MSINTEEKQVCEACGCAGEMGFIIKEGDDVAEVTIYAQNKEQLESELAKYVELAKEVCANVEHEASALVEGSNELTARFKFEVSAEKLIFELKTRSLAR
ncbi:YfcZ/YiiS family protein [Vibrio sp. TRT 21S02]|uniref:YfcZ/YiiS family protein n=1 Tax=unclassified Vibrio TaxID=2614977 RepID=UPI00349F6152